MPKRSSAGIRRAGRSTCFPPPPPPTLPALVHGDFSHLPQRGCGLSFSPPSPGLTSPTRDRSVAPSKDARPRPTRRRRHPVPSPMPPSPLRRKVSFSIFPFSFSDQVSFQTSLCEKPCKPGTLDFPTGPGETPRTAKAARRLGNFPSADWQLRGLLLPARLPSSLLVFFDLHTAPFGAVI